MHDLPLARFAPISLEELNATAQLLSRIDRKYVLDRTRADQLLGGLDGVSVVEIDGRRQSSYETIYFDTPDLLSFKMSALARDKKVKIRTRTYADSHTSFLEAKTCGGSSEVTVKERIPYDWSRRGSLTDEGRAFAGGAMASVGVCAARSQDLRATITTSYRRATILAPAGQGRITIDTDLRWQLPNGTALELPDLVIMETKSRRAATDIDRLLWHNHSRPQPVSKFATGLAALRPGLPHNRWARLLRGPFIPASSNENLCPVV